MHKTGSIVLAVAAALATAPAALAASPPSANLSPNAAGEGSVAWSGTVSVGTALAGVSDDCFGADGKPDPGSGCDFFALNVSTPDGFYEGHLGGVDVDLSGFGALDVDLGVYRRNPDGTHGQPVTGSGNVAGEPEHTTISAAQGSYYVVAVPYAVLPGQNYSGAARFNSKRALLSLSELNRRPPAGLTNYRASHDRYISHSESTIAMDPRDHNHLIAASKMYENLAYYLFKVGTYESFDGGRTWRDYGQLPGYCQGPGECDPNDVGRYRLVSDPSLAFDDEGNAYSNTLDAPGGTSGSGWNMTVHIKRPGQPWSQPIVAHDNRREPISNNFLLDDKNWIAVDNHTDVNGGPNRPGDGKIGTAYICWSLDGPTPASQQVVLMRSVDGGKTWGGILPGDNIPLPLSQKSVIAGIGCHISIGPSGEVYATWYDNQLDSLMQVKSTNRGRSFSLARPIANIVGVNAPFEGQSFRNLSLPSTAVDRKGTVYVVSTSANAAGTPLLGDVSPEELKRLKERRRLELADGGAGTCPDPNGQAPPNPSCSDIVLFKSTDGGRSYSGPVRVNQDGKSSPGDQFQPWIAVTDSGQLNVSYFDRRRDPDNFFIDTYLSRSNDGGRTFSDTRVSRRSWDPRINPPVSPSGEFIGDYQGLVADDKVAIPFWNDTQAASLARTDKNYSPYQEVYAARVPNGPSQGGPRCLRRKIKVGRTSIGRLAVGRTKSRVARLLGRPSRQSARVWTYCVSGGGRVLAVFSPRKRVLLGASTARGHQRLGVGRGSSTRKLRRRFGRRLRGMGRGVFRVRSGSSRRVVFGTRRGKVTFVAVADRSLLVKPARLRRELRRGRLVGR